MMRVATRLIPADAAVVIGGGHFFSFPSIYLDRPANGSLLVPVGAAAIGQALPIGIGASQAQRDRPVVVLEGDGSILMHIQELETARRLHAHIMVVLMNDEALTAERLGLQFSGYNPEIVMYDSPDFVSIARGFGWQAMRVTELSELGTAFAMFAQTDGPALVDVRISQQVLINPTEIHDLSRAPA
jgi:thiamine pyrophosphate-dependent acetolactate synthase large subunit-like protein